jgi:hypothetical protein
MRPAALGIAYYAWLSRRMWLKPGLSIAAGLAVIGVGLLLVGEIFSALALCNAYFFLLFCCPVFSVLLEEKANRSGYPQALFRLPVPTATLVFWPWVFGTTGMALWWLAPALLLNLLHKESVPVLVPALGLAATIAWLDVAVWAPFRDLVVKLLAVMISMLLPGLLAAWLSFGVEMPYYAVAAVLAACVAISFPAAITAVAADRRGDVWLERLVLAGSLQPRYREPSPDSRAFASIARAQRWYNSSSPRGRLVSLFGALALVPWAGLLALSRNDPHWNPHLFVFTFIVGVPLLAGLPVALAMHNARAKLERDSLGLQVSSTFVLLRPITSGQLAITLLETSLLGVLQSGALCLAGALVAGTCCSVVWPVPGNIARAVMGYLDRLPLWQGIGVVMLSGFAVVGLTWRLLTNRPLMTPAARQGRMLYFAARLSNLGQIAFLLMSISLLLDPATRPATVGALAWLGIPALGAKVLIAATALRAARKDGLLDRTTLLQATLLWASLGIPTLGLAAVVLPGLGLPVPTSLVLLWLLILLPLGRFALIPLGLEAARHR